MSLEANREAANSSHTLDIRDDSKRHTTTHEALYLEDASSYLRCCYLDELMDFRIPCEVIPNLEQYDAAWHPTGFMVYRLDDINRYPDLGSLRLHIWPQGFRRYTSRGYGVLEDGITRDGENHDHGWGFDSYNITGYGDNLIDITTVDLDDLPTTEDEQRLLREEYLMRLMRRQNVTEEDYEKVANIINNQVLFTKEQVAREGLFKVFNVVYRPDGETQLSASGRYVQARVSERRDDLLDTDIHDVPVGVFHAPRIEEDELAATLVINGKRERPVDEAPNVLFGGASIPIVGHRPRVTRDEALRAKEQLLALPLIQRIGDRNRRIVLGQITSND